jgi:nucleotidyltransferase/DNA polymerase involved in DNA repair
MDELSKIWGVGPATVNKWVAMGYRTLKDLQPNDLNFQQKIGLKYYHVSCNLL